MTVPMLHTVILGVLCILLLNAEASITHDWRGKHPSVTNYQYGETSNLLVVVIASSFEGDSEPAKRSRARQDIQRGFWRLMAKEVMHMGVNIYLVGHNSSVTMTTVHQHCIIFPGSPTFVPGIMHATVASMDIIYRQRLPGYDAPFVLRSNLSSFWIFERLLLWLRNKPLTSYLSGWPVLGFTVSGCHLAARVWIYNE
jgi:hypothetical protein